MYQAPSFFLFCESMHSSAGSGEMNVESEKKGRTSFRIQYASDLHLEFGDKTSFQSIIKPVASCLALAGDIGRPDQQSYRNFLEYCSKSWDHTFVVAGNHELYNGGYSEAGRVDSAEDRLKSCAQICSGFSNVHFLNRDRFELEDVSVLGATLWTNLDTEEKQSVAEIGMNDFKWIAVDQEFQEDSGLHRYLSPADVLSWHRCDREWLRQEIAVNASTGRPVVVITHHLPTFGLVASKYDASPINVAFASECQELLTHPVRGWIAGHTHTSARLSIGRMQLGVNPRGYPDEIEQSGFSSELIMDVDVNA
jgi:hypothetical protein